MAMNNLITITKDELFEHLMEELDNSERDEASSYIFYTEKIDERMKLIDELRDVLKNEAEKRGVCFHQLPGFPSSDDYIYKVKARDSEKGKVLVSINGSREAWYTEEEFESLCEIFGKKVEKLNQLLNGKPCGVALYPDILLSEDIYNNSKENLGRYLSYLDSSYAKDLKKWLVVAVFSEDEGGSEIDNLINEKRLKPYGFFSKVTGI